MRRTAHHSIIAVAFKRAHADACGMTAVAVLCKDRQDISIEISGEQKPENEDHDKAQSSAIPWTDYG